jgi:hypothetical protein
MEIRVVNDHDGEWRRGNRNRHNKSARRQRFYHTSINIKRFEKKTIQVEFRMIATNNMKRKIN